MSIISENLFTEKLTQLERLANWSLHVISKFETFIRIADDYSLFRVDPVQYAVEKGINENEAIDLFLHAAKLRLFDMEWNLICKCCGEVFTSLRGIGKVQTHFVCNTCGAENDLQLDDFIQVSFTIAPSIRENIFHHPDKLSAEDYLFRYRLSKGIVHQPDNLPNIDFMKKHTCALAYLDASASVSLNVETTPGLFYAGDVLHNSMLTLLLDRGEQVETSFSVAFDSPGMKITDLECHEQNTTVHNDHSVKNYNFSHFARASAGRFHLKFNNQLSEKACLWIFDAPADGSDSWLEFPIFLSGKRLLTTQTFRDLYRSEVIDAKEGLRIRDITFLFTDLKGSTALYDQLGDLKAYRLVSEHFDALNRVIVKHSGAVVKTIGDAVMASFSTPLQGMRAALETFGAIDEFNQGRDEKLILKIGLHTGHSIAVTLNERLDYFGQTVNIASRIQQMADANEIYISSEVYSHNGVHELLASRNISPMQANVKGVSGMLQVYKISSVEAVSREL